MDCQTKQLYCNNHIYEIGDKLPEPLEDIKSVLAVGCCRSIECQAFELERLGRATEGRAVRVKIYIRDSAISASYKIFTEFD